MENREWLENLKVGDKVVNLRSQYTTITRKIVEVTKVTKKYIVIGDSKYRKDDGRYVDRDTWGASDWIELVTEEHLLAIKRKNARDKIYSLIITISELKHDVRNITDLTKLLSIKDSLTEAKKLLEVDKNNGYGSLEG